MFNAQANVEAAWLGAHRKAALRLDGERHGACGVEIAAPCLGASAVSISTTPDAFSVSMKILKARSKGPKTDRRARIDEKQ